MPDYRRAFPSRRHVLLYARHLSTRSFSATTSPVPCSARRSTRAGRLRPSRWTRSSCSPITCTRSGRCRQMMRTSPRAGPGSSGRSPHLGRGRRVGRGGQRLAPPEPSPGRLAAAILGTRHPRRDRPGATPRLHPLQPHQAPAGRLRHAWQWSSFHRLVREGGYDPTWCCGCDGRPPVTVPDFDGLNTEEIEAAFGE